jgi:hypothetical protein
VAAAETGSGGGVQSFEGGRTGSHEAKGHTMSSEPSYPKDAAVGDPPRLNETLGAAVTAKEAEQAGKEKSSTRSFVRGAAIGVGSAAVVAALLYANRSRKGDRAETTTTPIRDADASDRDDS